jgi:hypothetical protein
MGHKKTEKRSSTNPWIRINLSGSPESRVHLRASPIAVLNLGAVKALCSTLYPCFAREDIFTSNRSSIQRCILEL